MARGNTEKYNLRQTKHTRYWVFADWIEDYSSETVEDVAFNHMEEESYEEFKTKKQALDYVCSNRFPDDCEPYIYKVTLMEIT